MDIVGTLIAVILLTGGILFGVLWAREAREPRIVCLMYHRLLSTDKYRRTQGTERVFALPAEEFERQIVFLKENGYAFVNPDDVVDFVSGTAQRQGRAVLLTFDDGCRSVYEVALPILQRHAATAVSFVTLSPDSYVFSLGGMSDRRMTDDELRSCDRSGISIGSHAVTHRPLRGLHDEEVRRELAESKQELERIVGREVSCFAVPGNWWDRRIMRIAGEVGYKAVWVSNPGHVRVGGRLFGLPRINVEGQLTLPQFAAAIRPLGITQRIIATSIKRIPATLLGPRVWLPLRKILLKLVPGGHISTRRVVCGGGVLIILCVLLLAKRFFR